MNDSITAAGNHLQQEFEFLESPAWEIFFYVSIVYPTIAVVFLSVACVACLPIFFTCLVNLLSLHDRCFEFGIIPIYTFGLFMLFTGLFGLNAVTNLHLRGASMEKFINDRNGLICGLLASVAALLGVRMITFGDLLDVFGRWLLAFCPITLVGIIHLLNLMRMNRLRGNS